MRVPKQNQRNGREHLMAPPVVVLNQLPKLRDSPRRSSPLHIQALPQIQQKRGSKLFLLKSCQHIGQETQVAGGQLDSGKNLRELRADMHQERDLEQNSN